MSTAFNTEVYAVELDETVYQTAVLAPLVKNVSKTDAGEEGGTIEFRSDLMEGISAVSRPVYGTQIVNGKEEQVFLDIPANFQRPSRSKDSLTLNEYNEVPVRIDFDLQSFTDVDYREQIAKPSAKLLVARRDASVATQLFLAANSAAPGEPVGSGTPLDGTKTVTNTKDIFNLILDGTEKLGNNKADSENQVTLIGHSIARILRTDRDLLNASYTGDSGAALRRATIADLLGTRVVVSNLVPRDFFGVFQADAIVRGDAPLGKSENASLSEIISLDNNGGVYGVHYDYDASLRADTILTGFFQGAKTRRRDWIYAPKVTINV